MPAKESKKREHPPPEDDKAEKLAKITVKLSKEGGHPHIVQQQNEDSPQKRPIDESNHVDSNKKQKIDSELLIDNPPDQPADKIDSPKPKQNDNPGHGTRGKHKQDASAAISPPEAKRGKLKDSKQQKDHPDTPENTTNAEYHRCNTVHQQTPTSTPEILSSTLSFTSESNTPVVTPQPKRRGRPRKVRKHQPIIFFIQGLSTRSVIFNQQNKSDT